MFVYIFNQSPADDPANRAGTRAEQVEQSRSLAGRRGAIDLRVSDSLLALELLKRNREEKLVLAQQHKKLPLPSHGGPGNEVATVKHWWKYGEGDRWWAATTKYSTFAPFAKGILDRAPEGSVLSGSENSEKLRAELARSQNPKANPFLVQPGFLLPEPRFSAHRASALVVPYTLPSLTQPSRRKNRQISRRHDAQLSQGPVKSKLPSESEIKQGSTGSLKPTDSSHQSQLD